MRRTYRVVIAQPGVGAHDQAETVIARALRDAGFEVIYTGPHPAPEEVAEAALQEDADAVGVSALSGADPAARVAALLQERGMGDVVVFGEGAVPADAAAALASAGVARVFTPGTSLPDMTGWLGRTLDDREAQLTG